MEEGQAVRHEDADTDHGHADWRQGRPHHGVRGIVGALAFHRIKIYRDDEHETADQGEDIREFHSAEQHERPCLEQDECDEHGQQADDRYYG